MSNIAVIILAAGKGTRMKSDLPKVMHKIGGKPMINHMVETAKSLNAKKTIVVLSPNNKEISKKIGACEIAIQKQQLGTGDAVKSALPALKGFTGQVVILYGDTPLISAASLQNLVDNTPKNQISLFGFIPQDAAKYGRLVVGKNNEVSEIVEFKDANPKQREIKICNSGIYCLDAKLLAGLLAKLTNKNSQKEYYLTDIVKIAAKEKIKTKFLEIDETEVLGVNDKSDLATVESIFQYQLRVKALLDGVTMIAPETVFLSADTKFGKDVVILPNVVIGENVTISDGVQIGPFAHIRPNSVIGAEAKVGNFVEIKNSKLGKGAKVSHLSYIGDSKLGADVNIGAGTITCNYDGYNKHETQIGDGAFIGSNSALIAPVKVGKGAIVAAGSVISHDVPENSLAVSRAQQKNLAGWATKFRVKNKK